MKKTVYPILMLLALLLLSSMQFGSIRDDAIRLLMKERLDGKIERLRSRKMDDCRTKAIEAARIYIDSLVAVEFGLERIGTLKYPERPQRPVQDSLLPIRIDSSPIIPLFDPKELELDSIEGPK